MAKLFNINTLNMTIIVSLDYKLDGTSSVCVKKIAITKILYKRVLI